MHMCALSGPWGYSPFPSPRLLPSRPLGLLRKGCLVFKGAVGRICSAGSQWGSLLSLGVALSTQSHSQSPSAADSAVFHLHSLGLAPLLKTGLMIQPAQLPVLLILLRCQEKMPLSGRVLSGSFALTLGSCHTNMHTLIFLCKVTKLHFGAVLNFIFYHLVLPLRIPLNVEHWLACAYILTMDTDIFKCHGR